MSGEARGTRESENRTSKGQGCSRHRSRCGSRQVGKIGGRASRIWKAVASTCAVRTPLFRPNVRSGRATGMPQRGFLSCIASLALLGCGDIAGADTIRPETVYVIDGDTIDVSGERYRLAGFDTPETYHAQCDYELALGREATSRLRELVASGQHLEVMVLPGRDRYGRGLARLFVGGLDVGPILISERLARQYDGGRREGWC